ncbi:MAG TPA: UvrB/UvrC motif-containing protein, partial [Bacteroidia bacterium]|nr:UvrB/UvrC motif-containing protein [Bacteroidia bacterium]
DAGSSPEQITSKPVETKKPVINMNEFSGLSASQLQEMLAKALDDEAYERASRIRDELKKRKK